MQEAISSRCVLAITSWTCRPDMSWCSDRDTLSLEAVLERPRPKS
jgi:hypothetical protein